MFNNGVNAYEYAAAIGGNIRRSLDRISNNKIVLPSLQDAKAYLNVVAASPRFFGVYFARQLYYKAFGEDNQLIILLFFSTILL